MRNTHRYWGWPGLFCAAFAILFFIGPWQPAPGPAVTWTAPAEAATHGNNRFRSTRKNRNRKPRRTQESNTSTPAQPSSSSTTSTNTGTRVVTPPKPSSPKATWPRFVSPKDAVARSRLLSAQERQQLRSAPARQFLVDDTADRFRPDEILLTFGQAPGPGVIDAISQQYGLTQLESVSVTLLGIEVHRFRIEGGQSVPDVLAAAAGDTRFLGSQEHFLFRLQAKMSSKQKAAAQLDLQYAIAKMRVTTAHLRSTGKATRIAVIDTGVDVSHPELKAVIADSYDATGTGNEAPDNHGTAITGIIAAQNTLKGVAPNAEILAVRAFTHNEETGLGEADTMSLIRAIAWAEAQGAKVFNMSFAGPEDPLFLQMLEKAHERDIVMVAASGNAGPDAEPLYPAAHEAVIAVTATDWTDKLYKMANQGGHIAVAAPGVDIIVITPGGKFAMMSGTSLATAHISGVIALLLEENGKLSPEDVNALIADSAIDLGPKGVDPQFGAGRADAVAALLRYQRVSKTLQ